MTTSITEKSTTFEFDDSWAVLKYDQHPHYRKHLSKIEGTKAVDLVGVQNRNSLFLIEIKDFRHYPIPGERRDNLPTDVAAKARDTIAGLVGACHMSGDSCFKVNIAPVLLSNRVRPRIVFLLIERPPTTSYQAKRYKTRRNILLTELKSRCRWLTTRVHLVDLSECESCISGLTINNRLESSA